MDDRIYNALKYIVSDTYRKDVLRFVSASELIFLEHTDWHRGQRSNTQVRTSFGFVL